MAERTPGHADAVNTKEQYDALNANVRVWNSKGILIEAYDEEGQPFVVDAQGNIVIDGKPFPVDGEGDIILGVATGENYVAPENEGE